MQSQYLCLWQDVDHLVYKVTAGPSLEGMTIFLQILRGETTAGLNGFAFFRFLRVARFCDSDGRCRLVGCSTARWWMLAAHWLKNGVITYLSHGQSKQGVWPS